MRSIARVWNRLIHIKKPEFLFSLAYFSRTANPYVALHRRLFFLSCNTPSKFFIQLLAYVRWLTYEVWACSYHVSEITTELQLKEYGIKRAQLFRAFIKFGVFYSLTPQQYIRHQLYKKENQPFLFHFIYDHQLPHFHHYINRAIPNYQASIECIADKYQWSEALKQINIPSVTGRYYSSHELKKDSTLLFQKKTIFCKPNRGSQSQGAFLLNYHEINDCYSLEPIHGEILYSCHDINHYIQQTLSVYDDLLVQPFVADHPELQTSTSNRATTTIRIITGTMTPTSSPMVLHTQLEIPKEKKNIGKHQHYQLYTVLLLHWETLEIDPIFQVKYSTYDHKSFIITKALKTMVHASQLLCVEAHSRLLHLRSVAFDVMLSTEGPVILEANYLWSISLLYQAIFPELLMQDTKHPAAVWLQNIFLDK